MGPAGDRSHRHSHLHSRGHRHDRTNRRIARLKATIDLIEASESEEYYRKLYQDFRRYRMDSAFRDRVLDPKDDADWEIRYSCLSYLNHYELVAISFKQGVLDEGFYRDWMAYAVIRDFREAEHLVRVARAPKKPGDPGDPAAFCNLEALCAKWSRLRRP